MTTPTLPPFHQKIFTHAKSATFAKDFSDQKNNPFRPLRPLREPISYANSKSKIRNHSHLPPYTSRNVSTWIPEPLNPLTPRRRPAAFTLIELLAVITIIGILAGLTLGAAGAVRRHGATSTAKAEVAALQAACERYFADNQSYPTTNNPPNPVSAFNPNSGYSTAGSALFSALFGTNQFNKPPTGKRYFEPKPSMVNSTNTANAYFIDPWGYAYGYNCDGTNAPLIWSTAGQTTGGANTNKWITSWPKM